VQYVFRTTVSRFELELEWSTICYYLRCFTVGEALQRKEDFLQSHLFGFIFGSSMCLGVKDLGSTMNYGINFFNPIS